MLLQLQLLQTNLYRKWPSLPDVTAGHRFPSLRWLRIRCFFTSHFPLLLPSHPSQRSSMTRPDQFRPHREDYWSDGATEILVGAWGGRYVQLNRGRLRQKDWKDVADAVNARQNGLKPPKTDIQCKNRIDTLKKKYKVEKSKPFPSNWLFYRPLNSLIGAHNKSTTVKFSKPKLRPDSDDDALGFDGRLGKKQVVETVDFSEGGALRELARAILKFGEIYERIESSKQQQIMELEKQRMEFTKDLEFQKMNMFMDTQLAVKRMKRPKYASTSGEKM